MPSRLAAMPLLMLAGLPIRRALPGALLLGTPLTLLVAISQVGVNLGQLDPNSYSAVLCAAIVSAVAFPLLARALLPRSERRPALVSHPLRWSEGYGRHDRRRLTVSGSLAAPIDEIASEAEAS